MRGIGIIMLTKEKYNNIIIINDENLTSENALSFLYDYYKMRTHSSIGKEDNKYIVRFFNLVKAHNLVNPKYLQDF